MPNKNEPVIRDVPPIKIDQTHYVNEATIELLQRRLESQVLSNFIRLIGIPVTGGGIVAVFLAAIVWVPSQIGKVIQDDPAIKSQISTTVETYLTDGNGKEFLQHETEGQLRKELPKAIDRRLSEVEIAQLVALQLPKSVEQYFSNGKGDTVLAEQLPMAVSGYLGGMPGKKLLEDRLNDHLGSMETATLLKSEISKGMPEAVKGYLSQGAGQQEFERVVKTQLNDAKYQETIRDAVNKVLRNNAVSRASNIDSNRAKAVTSIATPKVEKGGFRTLEEFLNSNDVKKAGNEARPLAIGFTDGQRYVPDVVKEYVTKTAKLYPRSDVYFLLHTADGTCLALCGPVVHAGTVVAPLTESAGRQEFVEVVNDSKDFASKTGVLNVLLSKVITSRVRVSETLESALRSDVWKNPDNVKELVAVIGNKGEFVGTTSRELLIGTLLE